MSPYRTIPSPEEPNYCAVLVNAEKTTGSVQKNKKQKAEKEAKLEVLKRSKYSLLKNEEDLTEPQKIKLEAIKEKLTNLKKMHELKEEFRGSSELTM